MATKYPKKLVEEWLRELDYKFIGYMPTDEALLFVNFIKEVNDGSEENETPLVHLKMMDNIFNKEKRCAILCHRGVGKSLPLSAKLYTDQGESTIQHIKVGDFIAGEDGKFTKVITKSNIFNKPMYRLTLADSRTIDVCEDHINTIIHRRQKRINGKRINYLDRRNISTKDLLNIKLYSTRSKTKKNPTGYEAKVWLPNANAVVYSKKELKFDPYTLGLFLGDGSSDKTTGFLKITSDIKDIPEYLNKIPYLIGSSRKDPRSENTITFGVRKVGKILKSMGLNVSGRLKFIPKEYFIGNIEQRLELLKGLMDSDGTIDKNGNMSFSNNSFYLASGVQRLVQSLGGISTIYNKKESYNVSVRLNYNPFYLQRKRVRFRYKAPDKIAIKSIKAIPSVPSQCISVDNKSHTFLTNGYTVTHNTTLFAEYLILFVAAFGIFPGFGNVNLILYVTDSIENGVKNLRRNVEHRYNQSEFLQKLITDQRISVGTDGTGFVTTDTYEKQIAIGRKFTDIRLEFHNNKGHVLVVKGYGSKALSLDSILYTDSDITTIGDCKIGDKIIDADGKLSTIIEKSIIFNKPMYRLDLLDGRSIKVSEDHINNVFINTNPNNIARWEESNLTTKELLNKHLIHIKKNRNGGKHLICIKNCKAITFTEKNLPVDPYLLGLLLGDGSLKKDGSVVLHAHKDDMEFYLKNINCQLGSYYLDKRNNTVVSQSILKIYKKTRPLGIHVHGDIKFIPKCYLFGSITQRLQLLRGLMDTDGTISHTGRMSFTSNSTALCQGVASLVRSLGGEARIRKVTIKATQVEIKTDFNIFLLPRKASKFKKRKRTVNRVPITNIVRINDEPSQCIAVDNKKHLFLTTDYTITHNTGVRGAKELGKRPTIAILDDLVSDADAESQTVINTIENTVYKAVSKALHPIQQKIVWLGTPFNARDPLYKAVESGAWQVSVYPICDHFPCSKEDFKGSWADRFPYEYVKDEYDEAQALGKPENFNQELMLRIMSDEDRLIRDEDIMWYKRSTILKNKAAFNFYITTDFATSEKQSADFSVISVWALNHKGYWYWVDGICKQQDMAINIKDLFTLAQKWNPQSVGIEVSGQQGGFVSWINEKMMDTNIYFNLASEGNKGKQGIRPNTNKMVRFNNIIPKFKSKEMFFPIELKDEPPMKECMNELTLAAKGGFKSKHDDFIDSISQLSSITVWRPSELLLVTKNLDGIYEFEEEKEISSIDSYIV